MLHRFISGLVACGAIASLACAAEQDAPPAFDMLAGLVPLGIEIFAQDPGCEVEGEALFGAVIAGIEEAGVDWTRYADTQLDHRILVTLHIGSLAPLEGCGGFMTLAFEQAGSVALSFSERVHEDFVTLAIYSAPLTPIPAAETDLMAALTDDVYASVRHAIELASPAESWAAE